MFSGKKLLITGGTGSFGHAVVKRFIDTDISEIRIFSRDEKKQDDMRHQFQNPKLRFYIGDVRDVSSVDIAMNGVDFVFHAAALKQVPSCEFYPMEAMKTNVVGTDNVVSSSIRHNVQRFIGLSTDKAVYPINAMGMSKAVMEKVIQAKGRMAVPNQTIFCCTRYGNVMASRGSVIPLFIDQMRAGKPITITDPGMTRFMMSLDSAVDLVLFAFANGRQGDLFVQKAPAATVEQLARVLKQIFRSRSEIRVIGTRHGEKKHETLLSREECLKSEDMGDYFRIPIDGRDLNYNLFFSEGQKELSDVDNYASDNTHRLNDDELAQLLMSVDYVREELTRWER